MYPEVKPDLTVNARFPQQCCRERHPRGSICIDVKRRNRRGPGLRPHSRHQAGLSLWFTTCGMKGDFGNGCCLWQVDASTLVQSIIYEWVLGRVTQLGIWFVQNNGSFLSRIIWNRTEQSSSGTRMSGLEIIQRSNTVLVSETDICSTVKNVLHHWVNVSQEWSILQRKMRQIIAKY